MVVINTQHLRLKPPEYLNKHEAAIWSEVVNRNSIRSTSQSGMKTTPAWATYCTAAALWRDSIREGADRRRG